MLRLEKPTRVVVFVRNSNPLWHLASTSPENIIEEALSALRVQPSPTQRKFLVNEKWTLLNIFVFDLYHEAYRSAAAHLPSQLPVIIVDYARKQTKASVASSFRRSEVNNGVAKHHNLNGWNNEPPFFADYTSSTPSYPNPRDTSLLSSSPSSKAQNQDRSNTVAS